MYIIFDGSQHKTLHHMGGGVDDVSALGAGI